MRIIARLDVKPPDVIKPILFEGVRKLGEPAEFAARYYEQGADEIVYIDVVASLYQRRIVFDLIHEVSRDLYIPFAVGGGIRSVEDVNKIIHTGADKVILNTNAVKSPHLIEEIAQIFGSQACTIHIQAKKWDDWYECYTDCGRNQTGLNVFEWAQEAERLGAGEILLSVIDHDGLQSGFDIGATEKMLDTVNIPVIAGSGAGTLENILEVAELKPSAIALSSVLHYEKVSIKQVKQYLSENGIEVQQ